MKAKKSIETTSAKPAKKAAKKAVAKKAATKTVAKKAAKKATTKTATKVTKKVAKNVTSNVVKSAQKAPSTVTHEELCYAAYLNYINRIENGIKGDAKGDWLAAQAALKCAQ